MRAAETIGKVGFWSGVTAAAATLAFVVAQLLQVADAAAKNLKGDSPPMYVNTYLLAVPEEKKDDYVRIAKVFVEVARDFGALEVFENWELEVPDGEHTDYRKAVKAEPGEKIVVAWVIWPDRATGARAHKGMFNDPRMASVGEMPFDGKRMIMGGFEPIVAYRRGQESV